jgi:hypothetical protein
MKMHYHELERVVGQRQAAEAVAGGGEDGRC